MRQYGWWSPDFPDSNDLEVSGAGVGGFMIALLIAAVWLIAKYWYAMFVVIAVGVDYVAENMKAIVAVVTTVGAFIAVLAANSTVPAMRGEEPKVNKTLLAGVAIAGILVGAFASQQIAKGPTAKELFELRTECGELAKKKAHELAKEYSYKDSSWETSFG
jgi:hypothetical protein